MFSILLSKVSHLLRFIVFVQPETPVRARSARQTAQNSVCGSQSCPLTTQAQAPQKTPGQTMGVCLTRMNDYVIRCMR